MEESKVTQKARNESDTEGGAEQAASAETAVARMASDGLSRRNALHLGAGAGVFALVDSILSGCRTRVFNSGSKRALDLKPTFDRDAMVAALVLNGKGFLDTWNDIGANPTSYPGVDLHIEVLKALKHDLDLRGDRLVEALRTFLVLFRVRANPVALFDELLAEGIDVVYAGGKCPAVVVDHKNVTGVVLNPDTKDAQGKGLLFQLGAYRPEMSNLTGHYILCDDVIERHDREKELQHKYGCKPSDGPLVGGICSREADTLVEAALRKSGDGTIDVVRDLARWLPVRVVSQYFGLPSGDGVILRLDNNALPLFEGQYESDGTGPVVKVTEELMYKWIANGFRNLFLNLGKDPVLTEAGRKSGAQLVYYIYQTVLKARRERSGAQTFIARMAEAMDNADFKRLDADIKKAGFKDGFFGEKPVARLEPDNQPNPLAVLCQDTAAYRIAAQAAGSIAGAVATVEEAITRVFDVLLRPENKAHLDACVRISKGSKDWTTVFRALAPYYKEALRFAPQAELVPRTVAPRNWARLQAGRALVKLAANESNERGITRNKTVQVPGEGLVLAGLYSAMHDPKKVQGPKEFRIGRPDDEYLEFGWAHESNGQGGNKSIVNQRGSNMENIADTDFRGKEATSRGQSCLGRFVAPVEIVEAMRAVFSRCPTTLERAAPLQFQKYGPLGLGDFDLAAHTFSKDDPADQKTGPGSYPSSLKVRLI